MHEAFYSREISCRTINSCSNLYECFQGDECKRTNDDGEDALHIFSLFCLIMDRLLRDDISMKLLECSAAFFPIMLYTVCMNACSFFKSKILNEGDRVER